MTIPLSSISPRQTFEDNMRPAQLLLRVFRLLDSNDNILTDGDMVTALRGITQAAANEDLMLIYNEIFLGLVRERAQLPKSTLRQSTLGHLLRQAVVASCTALETYLPALLRANLPVVIRASGRDFLPRDDKGVLNYFRELRFNLDETLRLLSDEGAAERISDKIIGFVDFNYLSGSKGIGVVGSLLGIHSPADQIAQHLDRDRAELMNTVDDTVKRRNDIVHRADRSPADTAGDSQPISFSWTKHAVDTIDHVCQALDELVLARVSEMQKLMGA